MVQQAKTAEKLCRKIDNCRKIKMILDHDLFDFQYADAIREVCSKCPDREINEETNNAKGH